MSRIHKCLSAHLDISEGFIAGSSRIQRRLEDLEGYFADEDAYARARAKGNPVVYEVSVVEPASGSGQLHYGLGKIHPGRVGGEYYMTKGHLHTWRSAAEVYLGMRGTGAMLLEEADSGESKMYSLAPNDVVYVPGGVAHRTINVGGEPLIYVGIYPADAGHDYAFIADRNFRKVLVERDGQPSLIDRSLLSRDSGTAARES